MGLEFYLLPVIEVKTGNRSVVRLPAVSGFFATGLPIGCCYWGSAANGRKRGWEAHPTSKDIDLILDKFSLLQTELAVELRGKFVTVSHTDQHRVK